MSELQAAIVGQDNVVALGVAGKYNEAVTEMFRGSPAMGRIGTALANFVKFSQKNLHEDSLSMEEESVALRNIAIGAMLLSFVLVTIIGMLVTRSIRQPLQETVDAMQRVANCDLTVQMKTIATPRTEFDHLQTAAMTVIQSFAKLLTRLKSQSESLQHSAHGTE